ncbi:TolC family protein [Pseudoduganella sp. UC29_106]|uniref:TolC family protein n=1 Tax=Pseudoduganella sp. UC29_106 TaxID=3374553 RepID=UPI003757F56D
MQTKYLFSLLGLAAHLAWAQTPSQPSVLPYSQSPTGVAIAGMTLAQAVQRAFENNAALRAAHANVGVMEGARVQAAARPNPELSFLSEGVQQTGNTQTIQISQALELGGKRGARMAAADRDMGIAAAELTQRRASLSADVTAAYFDVLTAQERGSLASAGVDLAAAAATATGKRVTAGKVSPVEQMRANVALSTAKLELTQAQSELQRSKARLAALWGGLAEDIDALNTVQPDQQSIRSLDELRRLAQTAPQMTLSQAQVTREQAVLALESARRVPNLTVVLGSKREADPRRTQTVVGLSIPLPLFDRNQGNVLAARRRVDKARDEHEAQRIKLDVDLNDAYQRAQLAHQELENLRGEVLPAAHSAYDAATKGFEMGKFSFLEVLDAQRTLFQTRAQYLKSMSEHYRAMADLERIVPPAALVTP